MIFRKEFVDNTDDPSILLRLPMTKASVRAMVYLKKLNCVILCEIINGFS